MQRPASPHTIPAASPRPRGSRRVPRRGRGEPPGRRPRARWILRTHALAALGTLALLPACGQSQSPMPESVRTEVTRIEGALAEIEARALRDPELLRMDQVLGEELLAAMVQADPGLPAAAGSLLLLGERHERAVRSGDAPAARELDRRIAAIEERYLRAQAAALRRPALARRVDSFNVLLRRRMIETDAGARELFQRYAELRGPVEHQPGTDGP